MKKIAFWNVNTGAGSYVDRKDTLSAWCSTMNLDLLLLEEVANTLLDGQVRPLPSYDPYMSLAAIVGPAGLHAFEFVNTLDTNGNPSTKCLVALKRDSLALHGTAIRPPHDSYTNVAPRRLGIKITGPDFPPMWVLHANASCVGGLAAFRSAQHYVETDSRSMIGGDFNYQLAEGQPYPHVSAPISWQGTPLLFTQWARSSTYSSAGNINWDEFHLTATAAAYTAFLYVPLPARHGVIDYLIHGQGNLVRPAPNCGDESMWIRILKNFDHCPVVYEIAPAQLNGSSSQPMDVTP